jgi:proline-specific peptidase
MNKKVKRNSHEGFIPVPGGKVWFKIVGKEKTEIPVLILHGGPGASHDYLEPLEELADERPVIFYDQLDCGRSETPGNSSLWTLDYFTEELHQVIQALGLTRVHLLGQSWGTALAIEYMLTKKQDGVTSLVLSGPLLSTSRWIQDQKAWISELPRESRDAINSCEEAEEYSSSEYTHAMAEYYRLHVCRLDPWPDCLNRSFDKVNLAMYQTMWGPSEFTVTGILIHYERVKRLQEIYKPALFTCGRYDETTPETTQYYRDHLPGSELCIFEDASHEHHLEKPQEYLATVRAFLRNNDHSPA